MEDSELMHQGAEAKLFKITYLKRPAIRKVRFPRTYRDPALDKIITTERIKAEVKGIMKCLQAGVKCPAVYRANLDDRTLYLEYIDGVTAKEYIDKLLKENQIIELKNAARQLGTAIAKIHYEGLIHGDLTTSNMLFDENNFLHLIDFGLSFPSFCIEDKAVDLYVLERSLSSNHAHASEIFRVILASYCDFNVSACQFSNVDILKKLDEVRDRGRKRSMVG